MTATVFRPAYVISVDEDVSGDPVTDLTFAPTEATRQRLADHKLIFRPHDDGFSLYAQYNIEAGEERRAPFTDPTPLVFGIWSRVADFLRQYHPDLTQDTGPNLYLSNRNADGSARASGTLAQAATVDVGDGAQIVGRHLIARADVTAVPAPTAFAIATRYTPVRQLKDRPFTAVAGSTALAVEIDLTPDPARVFTIAPKPPGTAKKVLFADDELAGRGAFGVLDLVADSHPGPEPAEGRAFFARFRRRS